MTRLSQLTLRQVHPPVRVPGYDREAVSLGVVHFGPGAFHRAHQAFYFDQMLHRDPGFGICAVSLRSGALRDALAPQDGLYVLAEREADPTFRVIGAIREVLVAQESPQAVRTRLGQARIVTVTVTEKGYSLTSGGALDLSDPDIRRDLSGGGPPTSLVGWLVDGLRARFRAGRPAFITLSCDNLSANGAKLRGAVIAFARACGDDDLADWIAAEAAFPCTMVDSITPATDADLRERVRAAVGLEDAWPVQRERFVQWVVEDGLGAEREAFAAAGVTVASSVEPFERAKLRLLNGAHSTLAYVGLGLGLETVAEAMAHPALAGFVERMMRQDVAPGLPATPDLDLTAYIGEILARFRNPAIVHRLSQIAWDGSQKLRFRLLENTAEALAAGRPAQRLTVGVAAWMRFVVRQAQSDTPLIDPLAADLARVGKTCDGGVGDVARFLRMEGLIPANLAAEPQFAEVLTAAYTALATDPGGLLSR